MEALVPHTGWMQTALHNGRRSSDLYSHDESGPRSDKAQAAMQRLMGLGSRSPTSTADATCMLSGATHATPLARHLPPMLGEARSGLAQGFMLPVGAPGASAGFSGGLVRLSDGSSRSLTDPALSRDPWRMPVLDGSMSGQGALTCSSTDGGAHMRQVAPGSCLSLSHNDGSGLSCSGLSSAGANTLPPTPPQPLQLLDGPNPAHASTMGQTAGQQFEGVMWDAKCDPSKPWAACLTMTGPGMEGTVKIIGRHTTAVEAARCHDRALIQLGRGAEGLNFPLGDYAAEFPHLVANAQLLALLLKQGPVPSADPHSGSGSTQLHPASPAPNAQLLALQLLQQQQQVPQLSLQLQAQMQALMQGPPVQGLNTQVPPQQQQGQQQGQQQQRLLPGSQGAVGVQGQEGGGSQGLQGLTSAQLAGLRTLDHPFLPFLADTLQPQALPHSGALGSGRTEAAMGAGLALSAPTTPRLTAIQQGVDAAQAGDVGVPHTWGLLPLGMGSSLDCCPATADTVRVPAAVMQEPCMRLEYEGARRAATHTHHTHHTNNRDLDPAEVRSTARHGVGLDGNALGGPAGDGQDFAGFGDGGKMMRMGPSRAGMSSHYLGVTWYKASRRWQARLCSDNRKYHLGYYATEEEAARAYDRAVLRFKGPHAPRNFPDSHLMVGTDGHGDRGNVGRGARHRSGGRKRERAVPVGADELSGDLMELVADGRNEAYGEDAMKEVDGDGDVTIQDAGEGGEAEWCASGHVDERLQHKQGSTSSGQSWQHTAHKPSNSHCHSHGYAPSLAYDPQHTSKHAAIARGGVLALASTPELGLTSASVGGVGLSLALRQLAGTPPAAAAEAVGAGLCGSQPPSSAEAATAAAHAAQDATPISHFMAALSMGCGMDGMGAHEGVRGKEGELGGRNEANGQPNHVFMWDGARLLPV